jgi:hypothetical protein
MKEDNLNTKQNTPEVEDNQTPSETGEQGDETKVDDKKKKKNLTFDAQMAIIRAGLANAARPGLFRDSIERYGYKEDRIAEGKTFFDGTETARAAQLKAIAAKDQKYRDAAQLRKEIHKEYMHLVVIGREEFKHNQHILAVLGLKGRRKNTIDAWREQVNQLYDNTGEPGVLEGYANHNITIETLEAQKQKLTTWDNLVADIKKAKSTAEKATEDKNKIYKKLLAWWRDFLKIVAVAVKENPQLKEQMSVVTPTTQ